jgi:hypothetical protein
MPIDRNVLTEQAYADESRLNRRISIYQWQLPPLDLPGFALAHLGTVSGPVLDVGWGAGSYTYRLRAERPDLKVIPFDLAPGMQPEVVADVMALPIRSDSAGAALASHETELRLIAATNVDLDKAGLINVSELAHHGLTRAIRPMHTMYDGDTIFTLAPFGGRVEAQGLDGADLIDMIGAAAADAMVLAVLDSAEQTTGLEQWPSVSEAQAEIVGD